MRIAILQTIHPRFDKRVFHKEARSLVNAGHEVISIGPQEKPYVHERNGVLFKPLPEPQGRLHRVACMFRLIRAGIKVRPDVCMCPEIDSWVAAYVVKLVTRNKLVFDVHEYMPDRIAKLFPRAFRRPVQWLTLRLIRFLARSSDHIILTRESLGRDYEGIDVPSTVVLNTNHLQPPCTDIPAGLREKYAARPTIIHQGIFGDVRGSYQLLDAMKLIVRELPQAQCILLGAYVYGSESEYREAVKGAGMESHIHMPAEVPFDRVPAYIAVSRVGLILFQPIGPGHTLGMPHKLFDYMREGIPVVAPDFCVEIRRIIEETNCGSLVDSTKPESIAGAVLELLTDEDKAGLLGANGRKAVENKYNWDNEEHKLFEVFESLS